MASDGWLGFVIEASKKGAQKALQYTAETAEAFDRGKNRFKKAARLARRLGGETVQAAQLGADRFRKAAWLARRLGGETVQAAQLGADRFLTAADTIVGILPKKQDDDEDNDSEFQDADADLAAIGMVREAKKAGTALVGAAAFSGKFLVAAMNQALTSSAEDKFTIKMVKELDALGAVNLTQLAAKKEGPIDLYGREKQIKELVLALLQRKKSNALLLGEPGVGKTAIMEGLAQLIVKRDVQVTQLWDFQVYQLSLNDIKAGAKYHGMLEKRLKEIIASATNERLVLFIDEIHQLFQDQSTNIAESIKEPASREGFRMVGATTNAEFQKFLKPNEPFTRRFTNINVPPLSVDETIRMLMNSQPRTEKYYRVLLPDDTIDKTVRLSEEMITTEWLPDKAITILEKACAEKQFDFMTTSRQIRELESRETTCSNSLILYSIFGPREDLLNELKDTQVELAKYGEKDTRRAVLLLGQKYDELEKKKKLLAEYDTGGTIEEQMAAEKIKVDISALEEQMERLTTTEQIKPLLTVTKDDIIKQIRTKIKVNYGDSSELNPETLQQRLSVRVIGQKHVIKHVADNLASMIGYGKVAIGGRRFPRIYLFMGPTGVGKTELASSIQAELFPGQGQERLLVLTMSNYTQEHTVSSLIGAPPGYQQSREGGILTNFIVKQPNSVIVFDEVEKAHNKVVTSILLPMLEGRLQDNNNTVVDCSNLIIIMTSNIGAEYLSAVTSQSTTREKEIAEHNANSRLQASYSPEILGRIGDPMYFYALSQEEIAEIVRKMALSYKKHNIENHGIELEFTDDFVKHCVERVFQTARGARSIRQFFETGVVPVLASGVRRAKYEGHQKMIIDSRIDGSGIFLKFESDAEEEDGGPPRRRQRIF